MLHHTASDASCCFSLYGYLCQGICSHQVMLFIVTRQCNDKFTNSGNLSAATSMSQRIGFHCGNISTAKTSSPTMEIYLPRRRFYQQYKYICRDDEFTNNGKIYALRYQEIIQPRGFELTKNGNLSTRTTC